AAAPPPWPIDPSDPSISSQWGADAGRVADRGALSLSIDTITPQNPEVDGTLSVRLTVENTSDAGIDDIVVRMQRADALAGAAEARTAMAAPEQTFGVATSFRDGFDLAAGESRTLTLSVPLAADAPRGLGIAEPGVYPVLINANGRPGEDIDQFLAETRTSSRSTRRFPTATRTPTARQPMKGPIPGTAGMKGRAGIPGTPEPRSRRARHDRRTRAGVGGLAAGRERAAGARRDRRCARAPELILSGESLSAELSPGGRLDGLLGALESELAGPAGPALRGSTCVAVDPELLDVADRMSAGYRIGPERPSPVQGSTRLRDSWGAGDDLGLRDGQGADAAADWLERLRVATRDLCVVTLPWSGAELNAVAATADPELATEALAVGGEVVERVLGRGALDSVVIPPEGYLDAASVPVTAFGDTSLPVSAAAAFESSRGGDGMWPPPNARTTSLVAANSLTLGDGRIARPGETAEMAPGASAFGLPVPLSAALAATGSAPEVAGYTALSGRHDLTALSGRHDLTADSGTARMQTAVGTLRQEISDTAVAAGDRPAAPIVAMPPAGWSAGGEEARALLRAVAAAFDDGIAEPMQLGDALAHSVEHRWSGPAQTASPNPDPGAISGTEVSRARQQSGYLTDLTEMMANDPQVALTRHGFTQPLRRDVLRALSGTGRRNADGHLARTERAAQTMSGMGEMLQQLRDSVTLVAPGGVYTRATDMSPVVIVGRNGLPLPVPAYVRVRVASPRPPPATRPCCPPRDR
ncbi:hypothetical protein WU86_10655, partial [Corynebacterium xerosis]